MKKAALILLCLIILTTYAGIAQADWDWPPICADFHSDNWLGATQVYHYEYGNICWEGDVDWFKVYIPFTEYSSIRIYTTGTTDTYGELYAFVNLFNFQILLHLDSDNNSGLGNNFEITKSGFYYNGWYYIKVRHASTTGMGAYQLHIDYKEKLEPH